MNQSDLSRIGEPPAHILLVEDDRIDVEAVRRELKKAGIVNPLITACDGVEGLEILKGENGHEKIPQPCIILLDINMPRMNGFQFLQELRQDPYMKPNVVFMLTTSARKSDKTFAYDFNAAGYILKSHVSDMAQMLSKYCQVNEFPEISAGHAG